MKKAQKTPGRKSGLTLLNLKATREITLTKSYPAKESQLWKITVKIKYSTNLSDELLSNKEIQILASDLRINNLEIDPYLKKAKTEGKNEEEMIAEVKTSIINLISQIIAKIYEKPD